jgi:uncharacterized protein YdeI (YjbR/CyaY-like superfamily)
MARATGTESDPIFFRSPAEYRKWLEKNYETASELWIGYYRKSTGKPSLTWPQTVDESLCFGWIDGIRKSIDGESFKQRVTPRRPTSNWSAINIGRVKALTAEGRMTPAGVAAFARRGRSRTYSYEDRDRAGLRPAQVARLKKNRKAFEFFQSQPPGYQRTIGYWVNSAAKEETRLRRLERLVTDCANGRRVGILEPKK